MGLIFLFFVQQEVLFLLIYPISKSKKEEIHQRIKSKRLALALYNCCSVLVTIYISSEDVHKMLVMRDLTGSHVPN